MKPKSLAMVVLMGVVFWYLSPVWSEPIKPLIFYSKAEKGLGNKSYTFRFSLWDAETGGNMVWEEEKTLTTKKSVISTLLGDVNSIDGVDFSQQLWVQVEKELADGTYVLVGEREPFAVSGVPYAMWALTPAGPQGPKGDKGDTGPQGPKGDTGATGPMGAQGPQGPAGSTGPIGPQGPQGATGPSGPQGPIGITGPQGPIGAAGPIGPAGPQGLTGLTGPTGLQGPPGLIDRSGLYVLSCPNTYECCCPSPSVLITSAVSCPDISGLVAYSLQKQTLMCRAVPLDNPWATHYLPCDQVASSPSYNHVTPYGIIAWCNSQYVVGVNIVGTVTPSTITLICY